MSENPVLLPHAGQLMGFRLDVPRPGALLVWQWQDGDWCFLDQLWRREYRHKQGGVVALWFGGLEP